MTPSVLQQTGKPLCLPRLSQIQWYLLQCPSLCSLTWGEEGWIPQARLDSPFHSDICSSAHGRPYPLRSHLPRGAASQEHENNCHMEGNPPRDAVLAVLLDFSSLLVCTSLASGAGHHFWEVVVVYQTTNPSVAGQSRKQDQLGSWVDLGCFLRDGLGRLASSQSRQGLEPGLRAPEPTCTPMYVSISGEMVLALFKSLKQREL